MKQATPKKLPPYIAKAKLAIAAPRVRLLAKHEVMAIANVSYPTLWLWMRAGKFPRARIVGGKSMWLSTEIDAWLAGLQVRPLKGDAPDNTATLKTAKDPALVAPGRDRLKNRPRQKEGSTSVNE